MVDTSIEQATKQVPPQSQTKGWPAIWASTALTGGVIFVMVYLLLIELINPYLPEVDFLPDTSFLWYYWQLPEPNFWAQVTSWLGYTLHQFTIWGLIYYAQAGKLKYTNVLHPVNIIALGANAFFVMLHLLQTYVWYDGLAQDTPILSSQNSVIAMLIMILMIENKRRGLVFGHGKKISMVEEASRVVRKYHGYLFSWAVIYTFWYHPMEATLGHLLGTFFTLLIMLQGSLVFTKSHLNKWWKGTLECFVLIHGTMVAYLSFNDSWPFFFFGFAAMFIITQMHGLGLRKWVRWGFIVSYVIAVMIVYWGKPFEIPMILGIPAVEIGGVFVFSVLIWSGMLALDWLGQRLKSAQS